MKRTNTLVLASWVVCACAASGASGPTDVPETTAVVPTRDPASLSETHGVEHVQHQGRYHGDQKGYQHPFDSPERYTRSWDAPERDQWQNPAFVLKVAGIDERTVVADIGAGTGYFSAKFSAVADQVFAVDVEERMFEWLTKRVADESLTNVTPVLGTFDDPKLPQPVDVIFVCNTYHHISERTAYFGRLTDKLRPGGRLVVVDYDMESRHGPPKAHRLSHERVASELEPAGYLPLLVDTESLPRQYLMVFEIDR